MFLGFINTKISNKHKLLSLSNLPLLFYQSLQSFLGKNVPSAIFWRINRTSVIILFVMWAGGLVGGGDRAIINENYLFHMFVATNKASNNKNT